MDDEKIKFKDIIEPDGSIELLIKQLDETNKAFASMTATISTSANKIVQSLKSVSGATDSGRKSIDEASIAADRLERAHRELNIAMSDTGKQIAWLKAQTIDKNKATVEDQRYIRQAISSYDRLKTDLKESTELYKSLSAEERANSQMGQQLLQDILNLKNQIKALDAEMKPHIETMTRVQKAEQELVYLQSEEGQRLLDLKRRIAEVTRGRKEEKVEKDKLTEASERLAYARSDENQQLKLYSTQIKEANRVAELNARIANSAEGSYNQLSAQYSLNKIKLNQMSQAEREAVDVGQKLEQETNAIYQKMIKLQEATGNYRLSVGHYQRVWEGLGVSVAQVVRELPSLAVSMNTFFLAISNNIPMVVDEIRRLRLQNKALAAEGKATVSVTKSVIRAFLNWNTVLIVALTLLSAYGKEIVEFVKRAFGFKKAALSMKEAFHNIAEEVKNTNASYGDNIVRLRKLRDEYGKLKTTAEKSKWIKENQSDFNSLQLAVNGVSDAENIFVENTGAVVEALKARAKAAAAQKLAADKYSEAIALRVKAEAAIKDPKPSDEDLAIASVVQGTRTFTNIRTGRHEKREDLERRALAERAARIKRIQEAAKFKEDEAEAYYKWFEAGAAEEEAIYKKYGFSRSKAKSDRGGRRGREPRDLTRVINANDIRIQKKYEESVTKLQNDEFAKRRKMAADEVQNENNKLWELYRRNEEYVDNVDKKYKDLTEDQKEQIDKQQKWIIKATANNLKALGVQLQRIQKEQRANSERLARNTASASGVASAGDYASRGSAVVTDKAYFLKDRQALEESLVRERKLMEEALDLEFELVLNTNRKLLKEGDTQARSEEEILLEFNEKRLQLWSKYDEMVLNLRAKDIDNELELVEKGSARELDLLLEQNEIARQQAHRVNAGLPADQRVSSDTIDRLYETSGARIKGRFDLKKFDDLQALAQARFDAEDHTETEITINRLKQERDRWKKQKEIAEANGLDWSKEQIDTADQMVDNINKEIERLQDPIASIGKKGLGTTLLEKLGFDDDQIDALKEAVDVVVDNLKQIAAAEVEIAQKAVDAANARVEASQRSLEAEIEARNNGYAFNVETAKKELEQEKKNQLKKQKLLERAQRRQEAVDTVVQSSSLITASANLWSSFSKLGPAGPALALAAIAAMWTSFAAAKIKARQVTAGASQEYGEGGLEFLEGGSHASGHDINLGVKNHKNKNMKVEGKEALAIINKRNTRKYKKVLPDIVKSLNSGTFEDKYMNAFSNGSDITINSRPANVDISKIERDVSHIREQSEIKYVIAPDGTEIIYNGNVKRIIRH